MSKIIRIDNHTDAAVALRDLADDLSIIAVKGVVDLADDKPSWQAVRKELAQAAACMAKARILLETW